ncbi:MAG: HlyD family efflux transporter periplasmic adaptor subunit [Planctomycetes bacterium]|nr:HlyD family efflux transporter periplasmic adaptor subunit [Planctomycetota bacterium]
MTSPAPQLVTEPDAVPTLQLVVASAWVRRFAWVVAGSFFVLPIALLLLPWQQNVAGAGRVVAYDPLERETRIEAPVEGRVSRCYIKEGDVVASGQALLEIVDNDPELLRRLRDQLTEAQQRRNAVEERMQNLSDQIQEQMRAMNLALQAADERIKAADQEIVAAERIQDADFAEYENQKLRLDRVTDLYKDQIASKQELENVQRDFARAEANLKRARANVEASRNRRTALESDRLKITADETARINSTRSSLASANESLASAKQSVIELETRVARQNTMAVTAPRSGTILRLLATEGSFLKSQSPIAVLIPETQKRTVELWLDGNDVPLVSVGRNVRLQFEGWPAVQFVGWPSVAIGTFGGEVILVDATDNGKGKFRILVSPKPDVRSDGSIVTWPDNRFLRQGVRANGWVLLERVKLGWELWRQLNGFPPVVAMSEPSKEAASGDGKGK